MLPARLHEASALIVTGRASRPRANARRSWLGTAGPRGALAPHSAIRGILRAHTTGAPRQGLHDGTLGRVARQAQPLPAFPEPPGSSDEAALVTPGSGRLK